MIDLALVPTAVLLAGRGPELALAPWLSRAQGLARVRGRTGRCRGRRALAGQRPRGRSHRAWGHGAALPFGITSRSESCLRWHRHGAPSAVLVAAMEHDGGTTVDVLHAVFNRWLHVLVGSRISCSSMRVGGDGSPLYFLSGSVGSKLRRRSRTVLIITQWAVRPFARRDAVVAPAFDGPIGHGAPLSAAGRPCWWRRWQVGALRAKWIPEARTDARSGAAALSRYVKSRRVSHRAPYRLAWQAAFGGRAAAGRLPDDAGRAGVRRRADDLKRRCILDSEPLGYIVTVWRSARLGVAAGLYYAAVKTIQGTLSGGPAPCSTSPARVTCALGGSRRAAVTAAVWIVGRRPHRGRARDQRFGEGLLFGPRSSGSRRGGGGLDREPRTGSTPEAQQRVLTACTVPSQHAKYARSHGRCARHGHVGRAMRVFGSRRSSSGSVHRDRRAVDGVPLGVQMTCLAAQRRGA